MRLLNDQQKKTNTRIPEMLSIKLDCKELVRTQSMTDGL